jgi:FtsZ-interacting cell division protein ZipA
MKKFFLTGFTLILLAAFLFSGCRSNNYYADSDYDEYDEPYYQNQQPSYYDDNYYYFSDNYGHYRRVRRNRITYQINVVQIPQLDQQHRSEIYNNIPKRTTVPSSNPVTQQQQVPTNPNNPNNPKSTQPQTVPKNNPVQQNTPTYQQKPQTVPKNNPAANPASKPPVSQKPVTVPKTNPVSRKP